jgi:hypothetical protein
MCGRPNDGRNNDSGKRTERSGTGPVTLKHTALMKLNSKLEELRAREKCGIGSDGSAPQKTLAAIFGAGRTHLGTPWRS